jgi:RNA polymerase sigma-70 factor (ECF subfamily)
MNGHDQRLAGLLASIARKDNGAMAEFHDWSRPFLIVFLRRFIRDLNGTEDILQEIYRQIWFSAASYSRDRGTASGWVYMIARSRAFDSLRKQQRDHLRPMLDGERLTGPYDEQAYINQRQYAQVRKTVGALPGLQRRMIYLAFFEGYTHTEIACETGLPLGTVKTRIRSGLSKMRETLQSAAA